MMPLKARNTVSQDCSEMNIIQPSLDMTQLSLIMVSDVLDIKEVLASKVIFLISLLISAS